MLFGARHGERADREPNEYKLMELDYDPHLTPLGCLQAQATGQRINEQINEYHKQLQNQGLVGKDEENKIEAIVVVSPFLRTLMTAEHLANQIDRVYKNSIFQQEEFCENIATWDFDSDPLPKLFIKTQPQNIGKYLKQDKVQLQGKLFDNNRTQIPSFPEQNCKKRVYGAIEGLAEFYLKNFDYRKYVVVYVSHQSIVEEGLRYFKQKIGQWTLDYCGLLQVLFTDPKNGIKEYQLLAKGDSNHIKGVKLQK